MEESKHLLALRDFTFSVNSLRDAVVDLKSKVEHLTERLDETEGQVSEMVRASLIQQGRDEVRKDDKSEAKTSKEGNVALVIQVLQIVTKPVPCVSAVIIAFILGANGLLDVLKMFKPH